MEKSPSWAVLSGEITEDTVNKTMSSLSEMCWANNPTLIIASSGGSAKHGFRMCDFVSDFCKPIHSLVSNEDAKSMAALVMLSCEYRYIVKNANLHFHEIVTRSDTFPNEAVRTAVAKNLRSLNERQVGIICNRTKLKSPNDVKTLLLQDRIMSAGEALELGFVDEIL